MNLEAMSHGFSMKLRRPTELLHLSILLNATTKRNSGEVQRARERRRGLAPIAGVEWHRLPDLR